MKLIYHCHLFLLVSSQSAQQVCSCLPDFFSLSGQLWTVLYNMLFNLLWFCAAANISICEIIPRTCDVCPQRSVLWMKILLRPFMPGLLMLSLPVFATNQQTKSRPNLLVFSRYSSDIISPINQTVGFPDQTGYY